MGNFIKLFLSTYFMWPKHPFLNARSHKYIQSTSVLWLAISKTRSPAGTLSPEKITLVLFIFSNKNGHNPSQMPKSRETTFLLWFMLKERKSNTATGTKYIKNINAVERRTAKHVTPLIILKVLKGQCFDPSVDSRFVMLSSLLKPNIWWCCKVSTR